MRNCPAPYPVYTVHGILFITPETAERFPDLAAVVAKLDVRNPDARLETWVEAAGSAGRAQEILDFLCEHHLVHVDEGGTYRWYRAVHCGEEVIKGVRVDHTLEFCR